MAHSTRRTNQRPQTTLGRVEPLNLYSHLWPGDEDRIRDAVDLALAPRAEDSLTTEGQG